MRQAVREAVGIVIAATVLGFSYTAVTAGGFFASESLRAAKARRLSALAPSIISLAEARALFDSSAALFIDARHEFDYRRGHIRGAISLPLSQFDHDQPMIRRLPKDRLLVVYCDGAGCNSSLDLAGKLYDQGFSNIRVFFSGWQDWYDSHLPVEKSSP